MGCTYAQLQGGKQHQIVTENSNIRNLKVNFDQIYVQPNIAPNTCVPNLTYTKIGLGAGPRLLNPIQVLEYVLGTAGPQSIRISGSLAMAKFSVKIFALFMW